MSKWSPSSPPPFDSYYSGSDDSSEEEEEEEESIFLKMEYEKFKETFGGFPGYYLSQREIEDFFTHPQSETVIGGDRPRCYREFDLPWNTASSVPLYLTFSQKSFSNQVNSAISMRKHEEMLKLIREHYPNVDGRCALRLEIVHGGFGWLYIKGVEEIKEK